MYGRHSLAGDRGAATLEMALLLPFLVFLFAITVDFGRVIYYAVAASSCARSGAMYAADRNLADKSPFESETDAALADAVDLKPIPEIVVTDPYFVGDIECVQVRVRYDFRPILPIQGIGSRLVVDRTAVLPKTPDSIDDGSGP